jgi:ribosomal protein S27AE
LGPAVLLIVPLPWHVFPIWTIRTLSLLPIRGCDRTLHFLQVESALSPPYAVCHYTYLANFCPKCGSSMFLQNLKQQLQCSRTHNADDQNMIGSDDGDSEDWWILECDAV